MVERERPAGAEKRARKRHQPGPGAEKQRRERGIDRLWWTVDSGRWNHVVKERVSPERERVDERNGKVKKVWESKKKLGK